MSGDHSPDMYILCNSCGGTFNLTDIRPINTLWGQLNIEIDSGLLKCAMLLWKVQELDTEFRQYCFRWYQCMINGNMVISHFVDGDRYCSFCKIVRLREEENRLGW
jgi:hypothetical protein